MATAYLHPALISGRAYLAPLAAPAVVPPPDSSSPTPAPSPTAADVYLYTIMRLSTINLQAAPGPAEINLTVSLT